MAHAPAFLTLLDPCTMWLLVILAWGKNNILKVENQVQSPAEGPVGKDACHQALRPEIVPGARSVKEEGSPLIVLWLPHAWHGTCVPFPSTHTHTISIIKDLKQRQVESIRTSIENKITHKESQVVPSLEGQSQSNGKLISTTLSKTTTKNNYSLSVISKGQESKPGLSRFHLGLPNPKPSLLVCASFFQLESQILFLSWICIRLQGSSGLQSTWESWGVLENRALSRSDNCSDVMATIASPSRWHSCSTCPNTKIHRPQRMGFRERFIMNA